jgi:hypothetical protein
MRHFPSVRALVGGAAVTLIASVGLAVTPASADEVNSVPPNKIDQTPVTCSGGSDLVLVGSGLSWSNPDSWQAYSHSTETTSADGTLNTRMDYYLGASTYSKFRQCYDGHERYILSPESTLTKRYTLTRRSDDGGVAVLYSGWSGWY